jgi:uncharacterized paraquat-inducible protein A
MNAPFAPPLVAPRIHAPNCHCPRCRHVLRRYQDPRERRVRTVMFTLAILIGGALGHAFTPQQVAAGIAATIMGAGR